MHNMHKLIILKPLNDSNYYLKFKIFVYENGCGAGINWSQFTIYFFFPGIHIAAIQSVSNKAKIVFNWTIFNLFKTDQNYKLLPIFVFGKTIWAKKSTFYCAFILLFIRWTTKFDLVGISDTHIGIFWNFRQKPVFKNLLGKNIVQSYCLSEFLQKNFLSNPYNKESNVQYLNKTTNPNAEADKKREIFYSAGFCFVFKAKK